MRPGPPPASSRRALASWLRGFLHYAGVPRPLERLGQHFLIDPAVIHAFRRALRGIDSDAVEVGPGPGTLTYHLAPSVRKLVAVEIDGRMARALAQAGFLPGNVAVVHGDGVAVAAAAPVGVVYSNTPYNVSSPLIEAIAYNQSVEVAALMLQKEVAYRLAAEPGSGEYGRLTLLVRRFFHVEIVGLFGRRSFYPPPKVDSALVVLRRRRTPSRLDRVVDDLARCMFSQKNRLAARVFERCTGLDAAPVAGIVGGKRVRELSPEDFEALARYVMSMLRGEHT